MAAKISKLSTFKSDTPNSKTANDTFVARGAHVNALNDKLNEVIDQVSDSNETVQINPSSKTFIYIDHTGDDRYGDGTQSNPFKTIKQAVTALPKKMEGGINTYGILVLGQGKWYMSDIINNVKQFDYYIQIQGNSEVYTTLEGVTYNNDYTWTTTTNLTTDELKGKFLNRGYGAVFGWYRVTPILENTVNTLKAPAFAGTPSTAEVLDFNTEIVCDVLFITDFHYLSFVNCLISNSTGQRLEFRRCSNSGFYYCKFEMSVASYEMFTIRYGEANTFTRCYFEANPTSSSGDVIDIWESWKNTVALCVFSNETATANQGCDQKGGVHNIYDGNMFKGFGQAIKFEGGIHYITGNYAEDCTSLLYCEEHAEVHLQEPNATSEVNSILVNTTYYLQEGTSENAGRQIKLPNTVLTLGGGSFSNVYTNLQKDLALDTHMQVGAGAMTYLINGSPA